MDVSRIYITGMGLSDWPVVNGLWASIVHRGYIPDRLYLLSTFDDEGREKRLVGWLNAVLRGNGSDVKVEVIRIDAYEFTFAINAIREIVTRERKAGSEIAVDITAGRKAVVAGVLMSGCDITFDHVFYLYIENLRYSEYPYLMIPLCMQRHYDFVEETSDVC